MEMEKEFEQIDKAGSWAAIYQSPRWLPIPVIPYSPAPHNAVSASDGLLIRRCAPQPRISDMKPVTSHVEWPSFPRTKTETGTEMSVPLTIVGLNCIKKIMTTSMLV